MEAENGLNNPTSIFVYQSDSVPNTLRSTGTVFLNRDETGSDDQPVGLDNISISLPVVDARQKTLDLNVHGFQLFGHCYEHIDYFDEEHIVTLYYDEICTFVKTVTGARRVVAFDHNVRVSKQKSWMNTEGEETTKRELKGGNQVQSPAVIVHNDYTLTSAPQRLATLGNAPKVNDTWGKRTNGESLLSQSEISELMSGRYMFINAWRNISTQPVQEMPLGFCDAQTFQPEDLVTFEVRYTDRVGENYFARHNPSHQWYYFPAITRDELILFKVWDSRGNLASEVGNGQVESDFCSTFVLHSAFRDPSSAANCPPRESIEVRTIAFF